MRSETTTTPRRQADDSDAPGEYEAELIRRRHPLGSLFVNRLLRTGHCEAAASRLVRNSLWLVAIGLLVFASWFGLIWVVVGQTPLDRPVEAAVSAVGFIFLPATLWLDAKCTRALALGRPSGVVDPGAI